MRATRAVWILGASLGLVACDGPSNTGDSGTDSVDTSDVPPSDVAETTDTGEEDAGPDLGYDPFAVTSVRPDHGTFQGGSTVIVRGRGFVEGVSVYFDDRVVQVPDTTVLNDNEIAVVTPAGPVGPVDVRVELPGATDEATLADGFSYDALGVLPPSGSMAGGTFVTIVGSGTEWADGDAVLFDGRAATDVTVVSAVQITCKTPPGSIGPADVTVRGTDAELLVRGVFAYYSTSDPTNGGLGGDPIGGPGTRTDVCPGTPDGGAKGGGLMAAGTVNITVLATPSRPRTSSSASTPARPTRASPTRAG
jgi:hypothetical protein